MIKKRTRPAAENPNALLLTTYNNLLKAYVSTNNKEATLDLLALIKEFIPLTKIAPNFTSYSIAMTPFVNTGDYTAVQKLFNEAAETSGRVPSINLSTRILAAIVKANNVEAGKLEIEAIQKRHADVAPTKSLLREMMRVYALDSETGTNAPEAWGIIKTLIQSAKSNDTPLEEIYDYSAELALANGPLQRGKELSTWDAWFDGIGKFAPRLKYATGMIGYAAIPSTASSTETFQKFLEAFDAAVVDPEDRRVEYGKVLKNLMAGNNILEAALFFESARVKGVEFGATGYSAMVSGLLKSDIDSKETLLLGLVDRMKANGFKEQFLLHNLTKHLGPSSPVVLAYSNAVQQEAAV
ncbi:hypothetical protein BDR26DRAFT_879991 [Obelidium mucronatum]|nr:hypothetical protein BDR26DRAFT_879991 [Obelidium mucronatum]